MKKAKTVSRLEAELWTWFSRFIRLRDSNGKGYCKCISCGKRVFWKKGDAGHFISRRYKSIKFDERNVNFQCKQCNGPGAGEQFRYAKALDQKYGEGTAATLDAMRHDFKKFSRPELEELIEHYKKEVDKMLTYKNLK